MSENSDGDSGEESPILAEVLETAFQVLVLVTIMVFVPYLLSGIWPPYVSVISGSMEPNIAKGDMVLVVDTERYAGGSAINGVETELGTEDRNFNRDGDVILYYPNGNRGETPVIHRAITYADRGENWVDDVNSSYLSHDRCRLVSNCPAPNAGFITLGDNNTKYDQAGGISAPVKTDWVYAKAQYKIPFLGWIRIILGSII